MSQFILNLLDQLSSKNIQNISIYLSFYFHITNRIYNHFKSVNYGNIFDWMGSNLF